MHPQLKEAACSGDVDFLTEAVASKSNEYFLSQHTGDEGDDGLASNIFHLAIRNARQKFVIKAMELLPAEVLKGLLSQEDKEGNSPLFLAVQNGCNDVVEKILLMDFGSYSLSGKNGSTPFHFAHNSEEKILKLLLEKHPEVMDKVDNSNGYNMLHQWAEMEKVWPFQVLSQGNFPEARTKVFKNLIYGATEYKFNDTPLHTAARTHKNNEITKAIIDGYMQEQEAREISESVNTPPWKKGNKYGHTPLHLAMYEKQNDDLAMYYLEHDLTLFTVFSNGGESPLFAAVGDGCGRVVEKILTTGEVSFSMLRNSQGTTLLHNLSQLPEKTGRKLLEKYWWMINLRDYKGETALDRARSEESDSWLVALLTTPSSIDREPFDWKIACETDETWAVLAFVDSCPDLQKVCHGKNDTPLHHIKLLSYEDYVNLLNKPSIAGLKNTPDSKGATPLHRAIKRKDMSFVRALLEDGEVIRYDKDVSLLADLYRKDPEWERMCNEMKVNPLVKTTYIHSQTDMAQMRNTLSVVAALLATITFAAGFTLPGGLTDKTGHAVFAKKASFLVFLLADAYAMCMSMLVLFCLIWSMVITRQDLARLLVDRSVFLLKQPLYGTMVAFMTGIYIVTKYDSLWAAILIIVMCSLVVISVVCVNEKVLYYLLVKLLPTSNLDQQIDQARRLEEGISFHSTSSVGEENLTNAGNQDLEVQLPLLEKGQASTSGKDDVKGKGIVISG